MNNTFDTETLNTCHRLINCVSMLEFRQAFDQFYVYRTPSELRGVIQCLQSGVIGKEHPPTISSCICGSGMDAFICCEVSNIRPSQSVVGRSIAPSFVVPGQLSSDAALQIRNALLKLLIENLSYIYEDLNRTCNTIDWVRTTQSADIIYYHTPTISAEQKTLIVGLTGMMQRLMIPTYIWLKHLDAQQYDLLLVRDRNKRSFIDGVEGCEGSLDAIVTYVKKFAVLNKYQKVIVVGTSGGALPAIYMGLVNEFEKIIAIGPPSLAKHTKIATMLNTALNFQSSSFSNKVFVSFTSKVNADVDAAHQIELALPGVNLHPENRTNSHNVVHDLNQLGLFPWFLDKFIN